MTSAACGLLSAKTKNSSSSYLLKALCDQLNILNNGVHFTE